MTKEQAITWAVSSLIEYGEVSYYDDRAVADHAAQALSKLSKSPWHVAVTSNGNYVLAPGKVKVSHKRNPGASPQP